MLTSHGKPCHSCMEVHAKEAWTDGAWGVPRSRRRPGNGKDDHDPHAARRARHAGSLRDRTAGRRAMGGRVLGGRGCRSRGGRAQPEEGARPRPRHRDHPRPLLLPGPRPASRPALHSREHRPPRHPGRHPLHHLQEGLDEHGPAARIPDRAVQVPRGLPGLPHAPLTANRAGPPRPAGTRRQQRRHQPVAGAARRHRTRRTRWRTP